MGTRAFKIFSVSKAHMQFYTKKQLFYKFDKIKKEKS